MLSSPFNSNPEALAALAVGGLAFGAANSLHCVGMCGPLIASSHGGSSAGALYHSTRTLGYALLGLAAGAIGSAVGIEDIAPHGAVFAFVLAGMMLLMASGIRIELGSLPGVGKVIRRAHKTAMRLPIAGRAAVLGAVTPLLPCGLLYAAIAIAAAAGSAVGGAVAMVGFALGAVPALAFAQWNFGWIRARLGATGLRNAARVVMLCAAAMLAWRGYAQWKNGTPSCCGTHEAAAAETQGATTETGS